MKISKRTIIFVVLIVFVFLIAGSAIACGGTGGTCPCPTC